MTKEQLEKGVSLQTEIRTLQRFINYVNYHLTVVRILRRKRFRFVVSDCYRDYLELSELSPELADRIFNTIEGYIADKKKELENL